MWGAVYVVLLLAFLSNSPGTEGLQAPIPLTGRAPGVILGDGRLDAKVKLQAFFDLNCPDSARDWPVMKQLADFYGGDKLLLVINPFPLPYHRNAYVLSHGLYLTNHIKQSQISNYIDACYATRDNFTTSATYKSNDAQVLNMLADMASKATGISAMTYVSDTANYEGDTRSGWKFAARRGVAGTPWYFVNDVDLCVDPGNTLDFNGWRKLLDPLINV